MSEKVKIDQEECIGSFLGMRGIFLDEYYIFYAIQ